MIEFSNYIISLNRYAKRTIVVITDVALCVLCTWLAFTLRLEELILFKDFNYLPALISIFLTIPIFWIFGLYRTIFRYTSISIFLTILASISVYGLLYFLVIGVYSIQGVPRSIGVIQPMLLFFGIISSRLMAKVILSTENSSEKINYKKNVLVYGAGEAGRQMVIALENSPEFKVIGFLDDDEQLQRQILLGKTVFSINKIKEVVSKRNISLVLLALPSISRSKRNIIIENLNKLKLTVKTLPSISEIVDGRITISDIKDLSIDDLLNREEVKPDINLLKRNIKFKNVLVTGAGGSIGSELSRQISRLGPSKIILFEQNEFALYKILEELKITNKNLRVIPLLGNVQDQAKLEKIFEIFNIETVYHAAAYKHVPLVEENICEGVKNNVFGTLSVANACVNKKVLNLVFISSDKAVRPTNIMGASKRLAELCMQAVYANNINIKSKFSIVRFGNVLESSGSVIPKFKKQIKEGGPVTLTHKDVTRYFMTVTEAAQLVIQAGAMGKKSEVFVLDMGESVKIFDLINKMIKLSGFTIKNEDNPDGDIAINIIGLRPGEKLYEELLIGNNPKKTSHPKIQKTSETFIPYSELIIDIDVLKNLLNDNNVETVKNFLKKKLISYESNSEIIDHIYQEQFAHENISAKKKFDYAKSSKIIKLK